MLFGLAIGLSVAFAVYVNDRKPEPAAASAPASLKDEMREDNSLRGNTEESAIDDNGETGAEVAAAEEPKERFDFYKMLPAFEMIVDDAMPAVNEDNEPRAIEEPGEYILQAGSFSTHQDADRRRAELALQGIVSRVQRAKVNDRDYYRVYIGPISDLDELNMTRSRLREAQIDVMRIRLGD